MAGKRNKPSRTDKTLGARRTPDDALLKLERMIGKGGRCLAGPTRELWRRSNSWEDALGPDV
jgi:hypothetical protein